jgi:hypothetical protein
LKAEVWQLKPKGLELKLLWIWNILCSRMFQKKLLLLYKMYKRILQNPHRRYFITINMTVQTLQCPGHVGVSYEPQNTCPWVPSWVVEIDGSPPLPWWQPWWHRWIVSTPLTLLNDFIKLSMLIKSILINQMFSSVNILETLVSHSCK